MQNDPTTHLPRLTDHRPAGLILKMVPLLLLLLSTQVLRLSAEERDKPPAGPVTITATDGSRHTGTLTYMKVPENRTEPGGRWIALAYLHFKTDHPNPKPPAVYLAGGPGASGINQIRHHLDSLVIPLLKDRDVIAFDQRGTGLSNPLPECGPEWWFPLDHHLDESRWRARIAQITRECAAFWRAEGVDLAAYNTRESAADLEALRRHLEVDQLAAWGMSYGSHLGLAYLRDYPQSVDRLVLAGIEGPDDTLKKPAAFQAVLDAIDADMTAQPELELPLPGAAFATVAARLEKEPARVALTIPNLGRREVVIDAVTLRLVTAKRLKTRQSQARLPAAFKRMLAGDFGDIAKQAALLRRGKPLNAMALAMDAASWSSQSRLAAIEAQAASGLLGDAGNRFFQTVGQNLGVPDLGADYRSPIVADAPVLLISGARDPRTPPANAERVLVGLRNGRHLVVDGYGHEGRLFKVDPIKRRILRFFAGKPVRSERFDGGPVPYESGRAVDFNDFSGDYRFPNRVVTLTAGPDHLMVKDRDHRFKLTASGEDRFINREKRIEVRFRRDKNRKVTALQTRSGGKRITATRLKP